ncbi:GTP-binding protein [Chloroflexus sp.]|uniref:CobW family GTP-binding protein n=1 Tax=Chloroflexus sp. TaxID=1904827 RepID=UPI00298EF3E3|nr:GTP-binding protein [Chloroflexus sp.]MCS6887208.1 GTP-binding protein [Chloroflexus sp.]MCX7859121.1 GTP-binding protein [Chloroflexus sp.]MDW8405896.1 GTP-binding protein [Chloroflexus sp.]
MRTPNDVAMPPITLISGFLGSGKTTLLRRLLTRADRRIGVIVNEFGAIGIDGALLAQSGAGQLIELSGGCVCCVAGSDLLLAIETLIDSGPLDALAIETSGLAEPGAIVRQLRAASVPLDALVTLVAATDFERVLAATPLASRQIQLADLIVLTHSDLADAQTIQRVTAHVRSLNQRAPIVPAAHGNISPDLIFSPRSDGRLPEELPHQHTEFHTLSWQADQPLQRSTLEQTLRNLATQGLFRAKGIVYCTDSPWADEVHLVAGRLRLSALRLAQRPMPLCRLVLIGHEEALAGASVALNGCIDSAERIAHWRERCAEVE